MIPMLSCEKKTDIGHTLKSGHSLLKQEMISDRWALPNRLITQPQLLQSQARSKNMHYGLQWANFFVL